MQYLSCLFTPWFLSQKSARAQYSKNACRVSVVSQSMDNGKRDVLFSIMCGDGLVSSMYVVFYSMYVVFYSILKIESMSVGQMVKSVQMIIYCVSMNVCVCV